MNKRIIAAAVASMLVNGCSMLPWGDKGPVAVKPGVMVNPGEQQAISEQRLTSDFKREGVRVIYRLNGELEALESTGHAPVWGNSENARRESMRVAELEAKKAMNDFINKETITSSTSLAIISKNLEKARDNKTNNFQSNRQLNNDVTSSDAELDSEEGGGKKILDDTRKVENTALREDALRIASTTRTEIRIQNKGILGGLQFKDGEIINDGKAVRVTYRWDRKNNERLPEIRNLMMQ